MIFVLKIPKITTNQKKKGKYMSTDNKKKPTFNSLLYKACKYMTDNSELFKEYAIYTDRMSLSGIDSEMALHNCLFNRFLFLTGKSQKNIKEDSPKGSDVMPSLKLEELSVEQLAKFLTIFYEYTKDNKKTTDNFFDINIEKDTTVLDKLIKLLNVEYSNEIDSLIKKINADYISEAKSITNNRDLKNIEEVVGENDYFMTLEILYNTYRNFLINLRKNIIYKIFTFNEFRLTIHFYNTLLFESVPTYPEYGTQFGIFQESYPQFGILQDLYYNRLSCDLFCHSLLELVITRIVNKNAYAHSLIKNLNTQILSLIQNFSVESIKLTDGIEKTLLYFNIYYHFRDRFLQDTKILKYITRKCGPRENPEEKYRIPPSWIGRTDIPPDEIKKKFTEGEEIRTETFRKQYEKCIKDINKFNQKAHRSISKDLICQKAFYREIFLDKTKFTHNRHTSSIIFTHLLNKGTMSPSDYYFVDEKINMGIFREYGLIDEFYAKNELQENLYHLISLILSQVYPQNISFALNESIIEICNILPKLIPDLRPNGNIDYSPQIWIP